MAEKYPLIELVRTDDRSFEDIKSFLERNPSSINEKDNQKKSPLFRVFESRNCSRDIVRLLLEYGAPIDSRDDLGQTPLIYGLKQRSDDDAIIELVEKGANVNVQDKYGYSPLCLALNLRKTKGIIVSVLKMGCSVQTCAIHGSPLHCFVELGIQDLEPNVSEEVMKLLIEAGVDVTKVDSNGQSPLCLALLNGAGVREINLLLSKGASVRDCKKHDSPILCVTDWESEKILKADVLELLLNKGASVKEVNDEDCTPLQLALRDCRYETAAIQILLDLAGMKNIAKIKHAYYGNLLHFAVANRDCKYRIVKLLLRNGVRCDELNAHGGTPLHEIMRYGNGYLRIVKLLIKNSSLINLKCKEGYTPLSLAVLYRMPCDIFEALLAAGAVFFKLTNRYENPILEHDLKNIFSYGINRFKILLKWSLIQMPNICIKDLFGAHKDIEELARFAEECTLDLKRMGSVVIGQNITLSDFIKEKLPRNVAGDRYPKLSVGIDELLRGISNNQFFKFVDVVSSKISKLLLIEKLQQLSVNTVKIDFPCIKIITDCNYDCLSKIAKYLTNQELLCLILTFYL